MSSRNRLRRRRTERNAKHVNDAVLAFYGPNTSKATKVVVTIFDRGGSVVAIQKWVNDWVDLRWERPIMDAVMDFVQENSADTILTCQGADNLPTIIGCPHEDADCDCPIWVGRERFTGEVSRG